MDATCPLVTKVHLEVLRFAKDGYTIIFIGHRKHDEADRHGRRGAEHRSSSSNRPKRSSGCRCRDPEKVAYVTQTTLSIYDAQRIIAALKKKFPNIKAPPKEDICYATTNRQNAVTRLAREADLVLVIGSKNSSNSQRLVETAQQMGRTPT